MKKFSSIILILAILVCLFGCKKFEPDDEPVPGIEKEQVADKEDKKEDTPDTDNQIHLPNQPAQDIPEPNPELEKHDYSTEFDYFGDGHDTWNGEGEDATLVSASALKNNITMSMYIPQGWCYETVDYTDDGQTSFGIYFWPEGETVGKIYVSFNTENPELGCGTGIEFDEIRLGSFGATVVTYVLNDINPYMWNHISVANKTNSVKIYSGESYVWWHKYYETAIKIMSSLIIDESTCSVYDAIAAVEQYTGKIGDFNAGGNYYFDGNYWLIIGKGEKYKVTIDEKLTVEPIS